MNTTERPVAPAAATPISATFGFWSIVARTVFDEQGHRSFQVHLISRNGDRVPYGPNEQPTRERAAKEARRLVAITACQADCTHAECTAARAYAGAV